MGGSKLLRWERPDGTVIETKLPKRLPLLNCAGEIVGYRVDPLHDKTNEWWIPPAAPGKCAAPKLQVEVKEVSGG